MAAMGGTLLPFRVPVPHTPRRDPAAGMQAAAASGLGASALAWPPRKTALSGALPLVGCHRVGARGAAVTAGELRRRGGGGAVRCGAGAGPVVGAAAAVAPVPDLGFALSLTTFNILAPIYRRMAEGKRESEMEDVYVSRNQRIMQMLLDKRSSVICLQEFWFQSDKLQVIYNKALEAAGYQIFGTPRTNARGDGLLCAVSTAAFEVVDKRDVNFNDCGDRVAMVLRLKPRAGGSELIVVNTHLLFPHNSNSTLIRLREVFKILEFLEVYRREEDIGAVPIVMCGDWNGTKSGQVYSFMRSQGFVSTYDSAEEAPEEWVSHLNHHGEECGVDYIWLLNPSQQRERPSLTADWRRAVFAMIEAKLADRGLLSNADAFSFFAGDCAGGEPVAKTLDGDCAISTGAFKQGLGDLGLTGEGTIGLMDAEIDELVNSADSDGNGLIDYFEFSKKFDVATMHEAYQKIRESNGIWEGDWEYGDYSTATAAATCAWPPPDCMVVDGDLVCNINDGDLVVESAELPEDMAQGKFPRDFVDMMSDHAPLTSVLRGAGFLPRS